MTSKGKPITESEAAMEDPFNEIRERKREEPDQD